jgi:hypothetical protein
MFPFATRPAFYNGYQKRTLFAHTKLRRLAFLFVLKAVYAKAFAYDSGPNLQMVALLPCAKNAIGDGP